jgi:predicted amidohydrolase YtcJ
MSVGLRRRWALVGATIHTRGAPATAIGVEGGRLSYVGDDDGAAAWLGAEGARVDGHGLHVYPGLVDAHGHLVPYGAALEEVQLHGVRRWADVEERLRAGASALPADAWVQGSGWNEEAWGGTPAPTAERLDALVGGRPACLVRQDGHVIWASTAALRLAGVTDDTPDPPGGQIVRDARGRATGILVDRAMPLVRRLLPKEDAATVARRLARAVAECVRVGLTGFHDMGLDAAALSALRRADADGSLPLRVYGALEDDAALWDAELPRGPRLAGPGGMLTTRAVKLFADGALGSRGALLFEGYADEPENVGLALHTHASLVERLARASDAGFQPCVHAIGDRANRLVLDAFDAALGPRRGAGALHALRPRVEHCQMLRAGDERRFPEVGAVASMQPVHCTSDMPWALRRVGPERARGLYAWRTLLDLGVPLAFGSDVPVEAPDPRLGLFAACTRRRPDGTPPEGWAPEQRLTFEEALHGFTEGAAVAAFQEHELGRIAVGFLADLTIFDGELGDEDPQSILRAGVAATVVGGRIVHAADPARWPRDA